MKKWVFFCLCFILLFSLISCATKTVTKTEYVTVPIDIKDVTEPAFKLRPDNSKVEIVEVNTMVDVVSNSSAYLKSWILWQTYAEALEGVIYHIEEVYGPESEESQSNPI